MSKRGYSHTQIGWVILSTVSAAIIAIVVIALLTKEFVWVMPVVLIILLFALVNFATLTVKVDSERVRIYFGPGLIRKSFPLHDMLSSNVVRNPWYAGWGIRLTPSGWLFNVSGTGGVEVQTKGGTRYRIGSDRAEELDTYIKQSLAGG